MEIRDPIHGLIEYDEQEEKILNTKVMQRLRGIKQLALASLVYPGATHTRFEHSVGVMSVADKMARKLELSPGDTKTIRIASLLHDIGHGPFSHVSEQILEKFVDERIKGDYDIEEVHEAIAIDIIDRDDELDAVLNTRQKEQIIDIIKKGTDKRRSVKRDIVSGPIDADKLDYLLRDSHYTGVKYGVFDLEKIINSLVPIEVGGGEVQVGVDEEGKYAVEQLLLAIYHMHAQVYRHRGRRVADAMLTRGINLSLKEGIEKIHRLYTYKRSWKFIEYYLRFDDWTLVRAIMEDGKSASKRYFRRLMDRRLFKEVFRMKVDGNNIPDPISLDRIINLNEAQSSVIEKEIAEMMSGDLRSRISPDLVILDKQSMSNPTFKFPVLEIQADTIMVQTHGGQRATFPNVSDVFSNPSVSPKEQYLSVYAPLDSMTRAQRKNKIKTYYGKIKRIVLSNL